MVVNSNCYIALIFKKLLKMDELAAPDMEKSNLRPKSFTCQVAVDKLHASWNEVHSFKIYLSIFLLYGRYNNT